MSTGRTTVSAMIEVPSEQIGEELFIVCVAFSYKENAEAALRLLKEKGIDASICELQPPQEDEDPDDAPDGDPFYFSSGVSW